MPGKTRRTSRSILQLVGLLVALLVVALQEQWQSYHYCDEYSSFCSYSEVIRSIHVWDDTTTSDTIPTRASMVTPNITILLGELPIKATVPPLDMDVYYSNLDILPDAPDSPVFTKDR